MLRPEMYFGDLINALRSYGLKVPDDVRTLGDVIVAVRVNAADLAEIRRRREERERQYRAEWNDGDSEHDPAEGARLSLGSSQDSDPMPAWDAIGDDGPGWDAEGLAELCDALRACRIMVPPDADTIGKIIIAIKAARLTAREEDDQEPWIESEEIEGPAYAVALSHGWRTPSDAEILDAWDQS